MNKNIKYTVRWLMLVLCLSIAMPMVAQSIPDNLLKLPRKSSGPSDLMNYIPYVPEYTPIKRLRLVLHVFQKDDGSGNLQNTSRQRQFMEMVINHVNWFYSDNEMLKPYPAGKSYPYIHDSRIRMVVDTILYHRSTEDWNFKKHTTETDNANPQDSVHSDFKSEIYCEYLYKKYVQDAKDLAPREKDSALHIFIVESYHLSNRGMAYSIASKRWLFLIGMYESYIKDTVHFNHWQPGMLMSHEIGHNLGLHHPYDYHSLSDLPLTRKGATNDLMDSYPGQSRALTPMQMGQLHLDLSGHVGDIGDIVIRDWHVFHPDSVVYIQPGDTQVWEGDHFLWGNIVIGRGGVLVIRAKLILPPGASIKMDPKSVLLVDGGVISCENGQWEGIKVVSHKKFLLVGKSSKSLFAVINKGKLQNNRYETMKVAF